MKKKLRTLFVVVSVLSLFFTVKLANLNGSEIMENLDDTTHEEVKNSFTGVLDISQGSFSSIHVWAKKGCVITFQWYTDPETFVEFWIMDKSNHDQIGYGIISGYYNGYSTFRNITFSVPHDGSWYLFFYRPSRPSTKVYYTISVSPFLVIYSPTFKTTIYSDSDLEVKWSSNILFSQVQVDLFKGSKFLTTLINSTSNDGSAIVHIPWDYPDGNDYKIRILDKFFDVYDFSETFSIIQKGIVFLYQNEGDILVPHTEHDILWRTIGVSSVLRIDLCLDSVPVLEITNETINDGEFTWRVWQGSNLSLNTRNSYQFRIQECDTEKYSVFSPVFTITKERTMNITYPASEISTTIGNVLDIEWETDSTSYKVNISLMKENNTILNLGTIVNRGSYAWKVPPKLQGGSGYYFHINATDHSASAVSQHFTIKPRLKAISSYNLPFITIFLLIPIILAYKKIKKKVQ